MTTKSLWAKTERLQNRYPGATIMLDAKTFRVLARSKSPAVIAKKVRSLKKDIVPIFIGGPATASDVAFHHFCAKGE